MWAGILKSYSFKNSVSATAHVINWSAIYKRKEILIFAVFKNTYMFHFSNDTLRSCDCQGERRYILLVISIWHFYNHAVSPGNLQHYQIISETNLMDYFEYILFKVYDSIKFPNKNTIEVVYEL